MEMFALFLVLLTCHFCSPTNDGGVHGIVTSRTLLLSDSSDGLISRNRRPNGNVMSSSDPIIFPTNGSEENHSTDTDRVFTKPKKIPLQFLRELSNEYNVSTLFEKYVQNVKLKDVKGHVFLVNLQGQPINGGVGESPIVTTAIPPSFSVFGPSSSGAHRPVAPLPDRRVIPTTSPVQGFNPMFTNVRVNTFAARPAAEPAGSTSTERIAQIGGSSSSSYIDGSNGVLERITKPAVCEPELKTVEVVPGPTDPNIIYFPSCVRIPQCGGCCISNLLTCDPVAFKYVEVQIQKLLYKTDSELEYMGTDNVTMKAHTQCKCACSVKPEACTSRHYHDPDQCQCLCKNQSESLACHSQELKLWNPSTCKCECREAKECNSGYVFSPDTCTCKVEVKNSAADNRHRNRNRRVPQQRYNAGNLHIRSR